MYRLSEMMKGARKLVEVCARVKEGERVLVVTDTDRPPSVSVSVAAAAKEADAETVVVIMSPRTRPGEEPPRAVASAMCESDVVYGLTSQTLYHTQARREACRAGARVLVSTGITEDTLIRGPIEADFVALKPLVEKLAEKLERGRFVKVTSPAGTDISASIEGRSANADGCLAHRPGMCLGVPNMEVNVTPVEGTANGTIVIDASGTHVGLIKEPVKMTVRDGMVVKLDGGVEAKRIIEVLERTGDPKSWNFAEIAMGVNPMGNVVGRLIEDESAYGTGHFALGDNIGLGGKNVAPVHLDFVYWHPTIEIDGEIIMKDGKQQVLPGFVI